MRKTYDDIHHTSENVFYYWGGDISGDTYDQVQLAIKSALRVFDLVTIVTDQPLLHGLYGLSESVHTVELNHEELDIPPHDFADQQLYSDAVRVGLLARYGGTYIDMDDVLIRRPPDSSLFRNVIGVTRVDEDWGGGWMPLYGDWYRACSDPLVNWEHGHPMMLEWRRRIQDEEPCMWGQMIPTNLLDKHKSTIMMTQWADLLLHDHHLGFDDKRYTGPMILSCSELKPNPFRDAVEIITKTYGFFAVKNHGFTKIGSVSEEKTFLRKILANMKEVVSSEENNE